MANQNDNLNDRVVKLEVKVDHLEKENHSLRAEIKDIKTEIKEMKEEVMKALGEIQQYIVKQKGGWQTVTIIGSFIVGIAAVTKYIYDLFK